MWDYSFKPAFCTSPHRHSLLTYCTCFAFASPLFPCEVFCILHLSICLPILSVLRDLNFLFYLEAIFPFSDSSHLFSLPKCLPAVCARWVPPINQTFLRLMFTPLSSGYVSPGKVQQWVHLYERAAGEIANHSVAVWQSGVIWSGLSFLTTWKDVHHTAAFSPRQADADRNTQSYRRSHTSTHT